MEIRSENKIQEYSNYNQLSLMNKNSTSNQNTRRNQGLMSSISPTKKKENRLSQTGLKIMSNHHVSRKKD